MMSNQIKVLSSPFRWKLQEFRTIFDNSFIYLSLI